MEPEVKQSLMSLGQESITPCNSNTMKKKKMAKRKKLNNSVVPK